MKSLKTMKSTDKPEVNVLRVAAVVLAAGESLRTQSPKMLLRLGNITLIEKVIDNILASVIRSITVVLGAWRDEILAVTVKLPVKAVYNEDYREGMLSSVICGIRSLPACTDAALIYPGDHPFISGALIDRMISVYSESGKGIVIPVCRGRRGHPILINKKYFSETENLDKDKGLRSLSERFTNDVFEYITDDEAVLFDIDTIEDYHGALNKYNHGEKNHIHS